MRLLLDTHLLLWTALEPSRLSQRASNLIADTDNELLFSVVSLWEAVIKLGLNREDFQIDPRLLRRRLIASGYEELTITAEHTFQVAGLRALHKDPFDRILIAQAIAEGVILLTTDRIVARYGTPVQQV